MLRPNLKLHGFLIEHSSVALLLERGGGGIEGRQRERMEEVKGRLDRHCHGGAEYGFSFFRGCHCLCESAIEDGEYLPHDVVEDDAAAKSRLGDSGDASRFVECAVVRAQRALGPALKAGDKPLLEPDRLVNRIVMALL